MKLVLIPPGDFGMSADYSVTLTKPYRIGATEVTAGQFKQFADAERYKTTAERDRLFPRSFVSFRPASEFPHPKGALITWRVPGWGQCQDEEPVVHLPRDDM